ncbi:hypothetical protein ABNG02_00260 [Halorubrum ejinorense]|uniref:Uncharacterized protein n=1 Tax=Halorubrum ejinorense TaxID=425309 RepID=A0AAV3STF3_9EURY
MVASVSTVGLVSVAMTVLMVAAMLYLVWETRDSDIHSPSPGNDEQPELGDTDEAAADDETQGELPDGSSA